MFPLQKRVTVICGHYGTGKTNLSINLALDYASRGEKVTLIDMDVVNPYFRSADYSDILTKAGVRVLGPNFANTNLDTPSMPGSIGNAIEEDERVIIDAGGDDAGATVLGVYSSSIKNSSPDIFYVINRYRSLTTKPEEAVEILKEIETMSKLKITGIVNNSHLKQRTTFETIENSLDFANQVSIQTGIPIVFTTCPREVLSLSKIEHMYPLDVHVRAPWE